MCSWEWFFLKYSCWSFSCNLWLRDGEGNGTPLQYSCLENPMDGGRSMAGCSSWGREESETTERLHFHFLLSCIGEGNGNPLQCSCLENPRDRAAWWAAVYGIAQSRTRLKWLSSSNRSLLSVKNPLLRGHLSKTRKGECFNFAATQGSR